MDEPLNSHGQLVADAALAGYLSNYLERRRNRRSSRTFGSAELDALAAVFLLRLGRRLGPGLPACAAAREAELIAGERPGERETGRDAHTFVSVAAADLAGASPPQGVDRWLSAADVRGPIQAAWRAAFLAEALRGTGGPGGHDARQELARWSDYIAEKLTALAKKARRRDSKLAVVSQLAFLASCVLERRPDEALTSASHAAVDTLFEVLQQRTDDGQSPTGLATAELAQHLLAAASVRRTSGVAPLRSELEARFSPDRALLTTADGSRFETSPWVPLALLELAERPEKLAPTLAPPAPEPPQFSITSADSSERALRYTVQAAGTRLEREFDAASLNLIVGRALDFHARTKPERFSARSHADFVVGLRALLDRCPEGPTRGRVEEQIDSSIEAIRSTQAENGGWRFGRKGVPSYVYTGGARRESEFPDLQYTIDAAVPGMALALRYQDTKDERLYVALERTLEFFERSIGRVKFDGRLVWRLFPEDEKTAATGTAVNYELWNGLFFASFAAVARDERLRERLLGYVDASVDYAESHLHANGDIAYGDYVRERRTAYAAWDAMLLARIADRTGEERPMRLARRIVERLAEVSLPSGAMPNVVDYAEQLPAGTRWLVHRQGVGPYPIHTTYQLYYVVACALTGARPEAGLRALGFVLLDLFEPAFGNLGGGYGGDGAYHDKEGLFGASWVLFALGLLDRISAMRYEPDVAVVEPHPTRLSRAVSGIGELVGAEAAGGSPEALDPEAVRAEAEAAWSAFQSARKEAGAPPLRVDVLAGHAAAMAHAAALFGEPSYLKRAEAMTRHLLHCYRGGGDLLLTSPVDRRFSLPEAAAAFASLAQIVASGPPWASQEG